MKNALFALAFLAASAWAAPADSRAPVNDVEHNLRREQEFTTFNPRYRELKAERVATLKSLAAKVEAREAARQSTLCSHQILWELKLMIHLTAVFSAIDRRIRDLSESLDHPEREAAAAAQNPEDGSYGACFASWTLKLSASYEYSSDQTALPFRFLDRVNSPEKLSAYLATVETSDLAKTGIDHTFDLNEALSDLMRLILRDRPKNYAWDPRLKATITDLLLHRLRNPETGWWGERYVREGAPRFVDDLSMTFHTVSFLEGKVPDMPKVIDTALALKAIDTPAGWLLNGAYWNHNNMDVAVLFGYGWPEANPAQRAAMKVELEKMLHWCLTESLQPDGSFKPLLSDSSLEEANYFGAAFLARAGYFDRKRRFWTQADFPESAAIRTRIIDHIRQHQATGGAGGSYYRSILEELQ